MDESVAITQVSSNFYIQRNPICFIDRLPTETLEDIFILGARDYYGEDDGCTILTAPGWVNISYVGRHWRNVALNCPTLWTYLFVTSPRWTEELLARSKQAPLKLCVNLHRLDGKRQALWFIEQVMDHLERVQEFRLHLGFTGYQTLSRLSSRAPRLQYLDISTKGYPSDWSSALFNGDTPVLRTLRLTVCPVPWYSLKLSRLTTLDLSHVPPQFRQNTTEFLAILSRMQDLMHLYLYRSLASAAGFLSSATFHGFQKIKLPHLSRLLITAPLSTVTALLSCINIPSKTELRLGLDCLVKHDSSSLDQYAILCSLLAQRLAMSEELFSRTIRSLVIAFSPCAGTKVTFSVSERDCNSFVSASCTEWDCGSPLQISLPLGHSMTPSDREHIISQICRSMPLSNVQTIHVFYPPLSLTFWTQVLGYLQDLRYVKLSSGRMPNLASVLSATYLHILENQDRQTDHGRSQILVPALEELELNDMIFSTELEKVDLFQGANIRSLCNALSTRKECRGRLTITQCASHDSNCHTQVFDMEGWWRGGRFHMVDMHYSDI